MTSTPPNVGNFNPLTVPTLQKYEKYIPTAFNSELTMLQKVNNLLNYMSTVTDAVNGFGDQWNTIVDWVDGDGLTNAVETDLQAWKDDGTLGNLINSDLLNKLSNFIFVSAYSGIDTTGATSSQDALVQAVNDAYSSGKTLYWEPGTYLSTTSIPYLHQVKHVGGGAIKRGSNIFYVQPRTGQTNTLYVMPTGGVSGQDGLSSTESPASLSEMLNNILPNYGPVLGGSWTVQLYAGSYAHAYFPSGLQSENPITIQGVDVGGHPNVPTTVISDGLSTGGSGIYADHGTRIILKDLKATGYNSGSAEGFGVAYGSELVTSNCHTENCYYGIRGLHQASISVPDGIHQNNTYGIYSLQQTNHYIGNQNATDVSAGAIIQDCTYGFMGQEFSTGHVNWITIQNCTDGMELVRYASVNGDGILFNTNTRDVRMQTGGNFSATSNTKFSTASTVPIANLNGILGGVNAIDGFDENYFTGLRVVDVQDYNNNITTTSATYVKAYTLKTPYWKTKLDYNVGKCLKFRIYGSLNGTADTKHIQVRISDGTNYQTAGVTVTAPQNGCFVSEGIVQFISASEIFMGLHNTVHGQTSLVNTARTYTIDLTKDLTFEIGGYVANTSDNIHIDLTELSVVG